MWLINALLTSQKGMQFKKYGMVANNTAINKSMIRGAGFGMHELTSGAISDVFWQSCAF